MFIANCTSRSPGSSRPLGSVFIVLNKNKTWRGNPLRVEAKIGKGAVKKGEEHPRLHGNECSGNTAQWKYPVRATSWARCSAANKVFQINEKNSETMPRPKKKWQLCNGLHSIKDCFRFKNSEGKTPLQKISEISHTSSTRKEAFFFLKSF